MKLPLCAFAMLNTGGIAATPLMMVLSLAVAGADPPPVTLTEFTCGDAAPAATFTVTVMAG
jgi:hypothetical protein